MAKLLFEITEKDWIKGMSHRVNMPLGGLFQSASNFHPFRQTGFLKPSLTATTLTAPSTNPVKVMTPFKGSGGVSMFYAHSESNLYQYLTDSPYTQTDVSSEIDLDDPLTYNIGGAILWQGPNNGSPDSALRYIYSSESDLKSNTLPVASGQDTQILNGANAVGQDYRHLCIGADKNLYVADVGRVNKCITNAGTSGNVAAGFLIDRDHTVRALINDGRYLVIIADNNTVTTTSRIVGNFSCRVYFWDMIKTTADVIFDIQGESYLIGGKYMNGTIYIFGYNGIYVCNSATLPSMIFSFLDDSTITQRPLNPYEIDQGNNIIYWCGGAVNQAGVYAYGSIPGTNKIIFQPYFTSLGSVSNKQVAIRVIAETLLASVDDPKLYFHNTGSTAGNATVRTVPISLPYTARFDYVKVNLRQKLTSGQTVVIQAASPNQNTVISDSQTISYSASRPLKTLIFPLKPATDSESRFDDIELTITATAGVSIRRVAVYGTPIDDTTNT